MAIAVPEGHLPFIVSSDFYPMIGIGKIELNEISNPAKSIQ